MQDFAPFTPELLGFFSRPQPVQQLRKVQLVNPLEGPLRVVEGYQVKKLGGPAGYLLTFSYFYPSNGFTVHVNLNVQ